MGGPRLILLDTHIWIWANLEPEKLDPKVQAALTEESEIALSSVSVWETVVAMQKGRVHTTSSPELTVRAWLTQSSLRLIPLDHEIALLSRTLSFLHEDPADRFIAATAYQLRCPLATADDRLRQLAWLTTI